MAKTFSKYDASTLATPPYKSAGSPIRPMMAAVHPAGRSRSTSSIVSDNVSSDADEIRIKNATDGGAAPRNDNNSSSSSAPSPAVLPKKSVASKVRTWHLRLGHALPFKAVRLNVKQGLLPHLTYDKAHCITFLKAKYRRNFEGSLISSGEYEPFMCIRRGSWRRSQYTVTSILSQSSRIEASLSLCTR